MLLAQSHELLGRSFAAPLLSNTAVVGRHPLFVSKQPTIFQNRRRHPCASRTVLVIVLSTNKTTTSAIIVRGEDGSPLFANATHKHVTALQILSSVLSSEADAVMNRKTVSYKRVVFFNFKTIYFL